MAFDRLAGGADGRMWRAALLRRGRPRERERLCASADYPHQRDIPKELDEYSHGCRICDLEEDLLHVESFIYGRGRPFKVSDLPPPANEKDTEAA